jgi:hypothetical protein
MVQPRLASIGMPGWPKSEQGAGFLGIRSPETDERELIMSGSNTDPDGVVSVATDGGAGGLGAEVGEMVKLVAEHVEVTTLPGYGHFLPEECPDEVARRILAAAEFRS